MAEGVAVGILKKKWEELSTPSPSESIIYRVPSELRRVNARAFVPQIISIGPNQLGKFRTQTMEIHKIRYLRNLCEKLAATTQDGSTAENILESFVSHALNMEERARNCYERICMNPQEFVPMMVLDALFVVELFRKFHNSNLRDENDYIFKQNRNLIIIAHDLLLLENQLPLFVLKHFFEKINELSPSEESLDFMAIHFFSMMVPELRRQDDRGRRRIQGIKHLLGLGLAHELEREDDGGLGPNQDIMHLLGLVHNHCLPFNIFKHLDEREAYLFMPLSFIRSATELSEAGIRFKKRDDGSSLFDIKFRRGQMQIPTLTVDHDTEQIFRNLIAYEQIRQGPSIVMDYARLMDCLINYADDVALLSDCGIIDNRLGTKEAVANMFNKLNDYVYLSTANFYYSKLFHDVNEHCNRPLNLLKVKLKQKHVNTPWNWVLISIVAATILLLLTFLQTYYSVLSYYK